MPPVRSPRRHGWSPKYFPKKLVQYANTLLRDRILFGRDYPLIRPDRWMRDFEYTGFKPEVMPGILKDNAVRLLKPDAVAAVQIEDGQPRQHNIGT